MKRILFTIAFSTVAFFVASAQDAEEKPYTVNNTGVSYTKVIPVEGKTASELYSMADNYFTYNYVDANSVVQTQDREAGTIIGKGIYKDCFRYTDGFGFIYCSAVHILRIDCRDGRIRVILTLQDYKFHGISTSSRPAFDKESHIVDTYPLTGEVDKPSRVQKREQTIFDIVNEKALATLSNVEDYFINAGNTGVENDEW